MDRGCIGIECREGIGDSDGIVLHDLFLEGGILLGDSGED